MLKKKLLKLSLAILLVSGICSANEGVKSEISALYSFSPHKLSAEEQKSISLELDIFWNKAESNQDLYLPTLRKELSQDNHSPFFYYDASKLLLNLSNSKEDKQLAIKAFTKTDLRDINNTDYLITVTSLSVEGFDTSPAALHILSLANFKAFIPQHSLTLGQNYSLVTMLMPLKRELYVDKLLKLSDVETDEDNLKSLILVLWYADTQDALNRISTIAHNQFYSSEFRETSANLAQYDEGFKRSIPIEKVNRLREEVKIPDEMSYEEIEKERRERFNRISDEALIELDQITYLMKKARVQNSF